MENHPIPQDVTGFQFRLIGDMTVKQFAYLAVGCVFAWLFFISPLPWLIKIPFAVLSAVIGASLAFVPIEGRPMDALAYYFLRALFAPDQYVYQKIGAVLVVAIRPVQQKKAKEKAASDGIPKEKLEMLLATIPKKPKNKLDEKESVFFETLSSAFAGSPAPVTAPEEPVQEEQPLLQTAPGNQEDDARELALEKEALLIQKELEQARQIETAPQADPKEAALAHEKAEQLEKELQQTLLQKQQLEQELMQLRQKLELSQVPTVKPVEVKEPEAPQPVRVRQIPKGSEKNAGIPFAPDYPNVIAGIVKDSRGNVLGNILVEVKDKDGNPVRAFKTNPLGQFVSATPLLNGAYTIWLEDTQEKHTFDVVQIEVTGEIMQPLEIISQDAREELRKALFSS